MRLSRLVPAALAVPVSLAVLTATPALAVTTPDYEAPFVCGQEWMGTTRASHSPSKFSVDFNRDDDLGQLVVASAPGVVTRVADTGATSYGKYLIVDHGGEDNTLYAHLEAQYVAAGQPVDQGTVLGRVGNSGGSFGAHLHFEERLRYTVQQPMFHQAPYTFGTTLPSLNCTDVPLSGNWVGKRRDEVAVYRNKGTGGTFVLERPDRPTRIVPFGSPGDVPLSGDWDGDGHDEVGVREGGRNSFRLRHRDGTVESLRYGRPADVPVTGDWDGDGLSEVGVWRPHAARFRLRLSDGSTSVVRLGSVGSQPVTGDWNGDRVGDVGVFDRATATFSLRTQPRGSTQATVQTVAFGAASSLPVVGDWDGDRRTDVGTWTPDTARFALRRTASPNGYQATVTTKRFGFRRSR